MHYYQRQNMSVFTTSTYTYNSTQPDEYSQFRTWLTRCIRVIVVNFVHDAYTATSSENTFLQGL